jgi:TATA-box binding protein (TBP) (component of TFIID and TFIIIB)
VIHDDKGTVIFFKSGKFRVMGCIDDVEATLLAYKYINEIDDNDFPEVIAQTYTSRLHVGFNVILANLSKHTSQVLYEPELFPAARMCKYKPLSVNVFYSGAIVICGLREPHDIYTILDDIISICTLCKQL